MGRLFLILTMIIYMIYNRIDPYTNIYSYTVNVIVFVM